MENKEPLSELHKLLGNLANSDQLKSVINNISREVNHMNEVDVSSEEIESDDEYTFNKTNILIDVLDKYFISKDGKNICDCLSELNKQLEQKK